MAIDINVCILFLWRTHFYKTSRSDFYCDNLLLSRFTWNAFFTFNIEAMYNLRILKYQIRLIASFCTNDNTRMRCYLLFKLAFIPSSQIDSTIVMRIGLHCFIPAVNLKYDFVVFKPLNVIITLFIVNLMLCFQVC